MNVLVLWVYSTNSEMILNCPCVYYRWLVSVKKERMCNVSFLELTNQNIRLISWTVLSSGNAAAKWSTTWSTTLTTSTLEGSPPTSNPDTCKIWSRKILLRIRKTGKRSWTTSRRRSWSGWENPSVQFTIIFEIMIAFYFQVSQLWFQNFVFK